VSEGQRRPLLMHLSEVPDPRLDRTKLHALVDILAIAVAAVLAGAESWVEVAEFGKAKEAWLRQFLTLSNGIPSHDTFGRVFRLVAPSALTRALVDWVQGLADLFGEVIAIDGKTARRSGDATSGVRALHTVSAFAARAGLVLGQVATSEKSNEITAIPELLKLLELRGCIVTIDAMGCQKAIAGQIAAQGGEYVLSLKENHPQVLQEVALAFDAYEADDFKDTPHSVHEETDKDHGRIEIRRCVTVADVSWFAERAAWKNLKSFGLIQSTRIVGGKTTTERRYYLSSLDGRDARRFASAVREHWRIENSLHWVLDVTFDEDQCRVRKDHAPANLAIIRHFALNLIRTDSSVKKSVNVKRLKAALDDNYRRHLLTHAGKNPVPPAPGSAEPGAGGTN